MLLTMWRPSVELLRQQEEELNSSFWIDTYVVLGIVPT